MSWGIRRCEKTFREWENELTKALWENCETILRVLSYCFGESCDYSHELAQASLLDIYSPLPLSSRAIGSTDKQTEPTTRHVCKPRYLQSHEWTLMRPAGLSCWAHLNYWSTQLWTKKCCFQVLRFVFQVDY